ncbi:hypothetical protein D9M70_279680 [compost metagenome]
MLVDAHPGAQQARVVALAGVAHRAVVGVAAGQQQLHVDPAPRRVQQRPADLPAGQEIRRGQPHPLLGAADAAHQRLHDVPVLAGVGVGQPAHALALRRQRRQVGESRRFLRFPRPLADAGLPLVVEQQSPVRHQRALDAHHHLVPAARLLVRLPEIVGGAGAADEGDALVDHQDLAVVAIQVAQAAPPAQRVVPAQLHAGLLEALAQRPAEPQRAEVVEQAAHLHAPRGGGRQRLDQDLAAAAVLDQVQLEQHLALGGGDAREHGGEEAGAVDQQREAVAGAPGEDRPHQRLVKISTALTGTEKPMASSPATWRSASTPLPRAKSSMCSTSGARLTTWKRRSSRRVASSSAS